MVHLLSIRKDRSPASLGDTVPLAINLVNVHGLEERFLMATASPLGLIGYPTTVALASKSGKSVSSTGEEWQNLSPLSLFRMFTRLDISLLSAMRFVLQRRWEFRSPSTEFSVTYMRFSSQGASTYTSSMCGSVSRISNIPAPTVCL